MHPLLEPSRQQAAPQSNECTIHEQDQDSFKDEYFLLIIFMSISRARLISLLRTGLKSNMQFWRNIGTS